MKTLSFIFTIIPAVIFSQVTIGKTTNFAPSSTSVLLEFGTDGDKGFVIPYVNGEIGAAVVGTVILDTSNNNNVTNRMKVKTDAGWIDLSGENGLVDTSLQSSLPTNPSASVIIGNANTGAPGILVLDSTDKAFVLPKVYDYTKVIAPAAGMIIYQTRDNMIAFFNGKTWSFWKP